MKEVGRINVNNVYTNNMSLILTLDKDYTLTAQLEDDNIMMLNYCKHKEIQ